MASSFKLSTEAVNKSADAVLSLLDGGKLRIYSGPPGVIGSVLLAELSFGSPAFAPSAEGVARSRAILQENSAKGTGVAQWFRAFSRTLTPVFDGSVGTTGADLNLSEVQIRFGAIVSVTEMTYTQPKG